MKIILVILFTTLLTVTGTAAANLLSPESQIKRLYLKRDFEGCSDLGAKLTAKAPRNTQLQAWAIVCLAKNDEVFQAIPLANKLNDKFKNDSWANFAYGQALLLSRMPERSFPVIEKLIASAPDNEEFILLYISMLKDQRSYDKALAFLGEKASHITSQSRLLNQKAEIYYLQNQKEKAFATFAAALQANPNDVDANYLLGSYLNKNNRYDEALKPLEQAIKLSPNVFQIRQEYWNALWKGQTDQVPAEKKRILADRIDAYLKIKSLSAKTLSATADKCAKFGLTDKAKELSDLVLVKFPQTEEAEQISINRIRAFSYFDKDKKIDPVKKAEYIGMLQQFINRPQHFQLIFLGESYLNWIYTVKGDKDFSNADFLKLAEAAVKVRGINLTEPYTTIVAGLNERQLYAEAETYSRLGLTHFDTEMEKSVKDGVGEVFLNETRKYAKPILLNNLGESLNYLKKYAEAEKVLLQSIEIVKESNEAFELLGKLYEAQAEYDKAEKAYLEALAISHLREPKKYDQLKNLYQKRTGSLEGYEAYLVTIKKAELDRQREVIVRQRESRPKDLTQFTLSSYKQEKLSSKDLQGKVVVINLWATWCGPCVAELPEYQKLYEKYKDDPNVSILSINFQEDADTIRNFMTTKKYNFPVLLSEKYISGNDIATFPTTWFIDKTGKISFYKRGFSARLLDEFNWRIEDLLK